MQRPYRKGGGRAEDIDRSDDTADVGAVPLAEAVGIPSVPTPAAISLCHRPVDGQKPVPLTQDAVLKLGEKLYIQYEWSSAERFEADKKYFIGDLPAAIPLDGEKYNIFMAEGYTFATLEIENNQVFVTFHDKKDAHGTLGSLRNIYLGFAAKLAEDAASKQDNGEMKFFLPGADVETTVVVADYLPQGPKLSKRCVQLDPITGVAIWEINYQAPQAGYYTNQHIAEPRIATPSALIDHLPEGMTYVADPAPTLPAGITAQADTVGIVRFELSDTAAAADQTISYQTQIKADMLLKLTQNAWPLQKAGGSNEFKNSVEGHASEGTICLKPQTATAVFQGGLSGGSALAKTGTYDPTTQCVTWTVTVNTVSNSFKYLKLLDTLGENLKYVEGSIQVKADDAVQTQVDPHVSFQESDRMLTLWLFGSKNSPDTQNAQPNFGDAHKFEITYETKVTDAYLQAQNVNPSTVKNKARLEYEWLGGEGTTPAVYTPPKLAQGVAPVGLSNVLIQKRGLSYDPTSHVLNWQVRVNPNQIDMKQATITDLLPDDGIVNKDGKQYKIELVYRDIAQLEKEVQTSSSVNLSHTKLLYSNDGRVIGFSFDLTDLGKQTLTFPVQGRVVDASFWATNNRMQVKNTVKMERVSVGTVPLAGSFEAAGVIVADVKKLSKAVGSYDVAKKSLSWTLKINESKVEGCGAVTITDTLPEGVDYIAKSAAITDSTGANKLIADINTDAEKVDGKQVTWKLPKEYVDGKTVTLRYQTTLDPASELNREKFQNQKKLTFLNQVQLISEAHSEPIEAVAAAVLNHTMLDKKTSATKGNKATYQVKVNPYGLAIANDGGKKITLKDQLSVGLVPDVQSVKVYRATHQVQAANGYTPSFTKGAIETDVVVKYALEDGASILTITIPDGQPYLLEYDAYALKANVSLSNQIKLEGTNIEASFDGQGMSEASFSFDAYGGAMRSEKIPGNWELSIKKTDLSGKAITFTKQDIDENKKATATFGLYKNDDNKPWLTGSCDPVTGICIFSQPTAVLTSDVTRLAVKELTAPTGYKADAGFHLLTDADLADLKAAGTVTLEMKNEKLSESGPTQPEGGSGKPGGGETPGGSGSPISPVTPVPPTPPVTPVPPAPPTEVQQPADQEADKPQEKEKEQDEDKDKDKDKKQPNDESQKDKKDKNKQDQVKKENKKTDKNPDKGKPGRDKTSDTAAENRPGSSNSSSSVGISDISGTSTTTNSSSSRSDGTGSHAKSLLEDSTGAGTTKQHTESEQTQQAGQPKIAQTGQNWYMVLLLTFFGLALLGIAVVLIYTDENV